MRTAAAWPLSFGGAATAVATSARIATGRGMSSMAPACLWVWRRRHDRLPHLFACVSALTCLCPSESRQTPLRPASASEGNQSNRGQSAGPQNRSQRGQRSDQRPARSELPPSARPERRVRSRGSWRSRAANRADRVCSLGWPTSNSWRAISDSSRPAGTPRSLRDDLLALRRRSGGGLDPLRRLHLEGGNSRDERGAARKAGRLGCCRQGGLLWARLGERCARFAPTPVPRGRRSPGLARWPMASIPYRGACRR